VARERHAWWWASGIVLVAVTAALLSAAWGNPALDHPTVRRYLTSEAILTGVRATIVLAVLSMALGLALGLAIALLRRSANPVARAFGTAYVWLVRGTPLLVQVLFWGNIALFTDRIFIGVPGTDLFLLDWSTNALVTPFVASVLALSLNEAAYLAEIFRGGLLAVDRGQHEAATALGLSPAESMRRVVLPQVLRVVTPPVGNQFITMLKMTSLVSVIAGGDLLTQAQNISAGNLRTFELLVVASAWYLLLTTVATLGQSVLERRLGRSTRRVAAAGPATQGQHA